MWRWERRKTECVIQEGGATWSKAKASCRILHEGTGLEKDTAV